jgi:hypothetical protein
MLTANEAREIVRGVISQEKLIPRIINEEMVKCDYIIRQAAECGNTTVQYNTPSTYGVHTLNDASRKKITCEIAKLLRRRGYEVGPSYYNIQIYWHTSIKESGE